MEFEGGQKSSKSNLPIHSFMVHTTPLNFHYFQRILTLCWIQACIEHCRKIPLGNVCRGVMY